VKVSSRLGDTYGAELFDDAADERPTLEDMMLAVF
jgi:hypothetical protein